MPFCMASEGGYYFLGWFFQGDLPFFVGCVIPLLNQTVSDYDSLEVWHFLVVNCCAELLHLLLKSVFVLLSLGLSFTYCSLLALILFELDLRVLMRLLV